MRGSIQRRGKGSWRLVFDLDRDINGKRRQKVVTYRGTKQDAERELSRLLGELENGGFAEPHNINLSAYLDRWLDSHAADGTAPKTMERYRDICDNHIKPVLGSRKLAKLGPMHVQSAYTEWLISGRRDGKGGLSARTVLHHHRVLRQALQQAVRWRLLNVNPCDAVEPPRPETRDMQTLSESELAALLGVTDGTFLHMPVLLAATTGLRRGEVLAVQWDHIDLDRGTLAVVQTLEQTKTGLRLKPPKTKRSRRVVTLPSVTIEALRRHKADQAALRLKLGMGKDKAAYVCARWDGELRSPRALTKEFARLIATLDLPTISFHGLRHSHATHLLRAGVHPKVAQERLGHSTIATTMDLYSHVTATMQEDAASRVDVALRAALGKQSGNK